MLYSFLRKPGDGGSKEVSGSAGWMSRLLAAAWLMGCTGVKQYSSPLGDRRKQMARDPGGETGPHSAPGLGIADHLLQPSYWLTVRPVKAAYTIKEARSF